jgi:nucleoid DNA-binding protein
LPAKKKTAKDDFSFPGAKKPRNRSEVVAALVEATEAPRKNVVTFLKALTALIGNDLQKHGLFTLPGLAKMVVIKKPATKARKGINPFTKEETIFKAKPARKIVKVRALKGLKNFVA